MLVYKKNRSKTHVEKRCTLLQDQALPPLPMWFEEMVDYKAS